jgi:hypothetical protein
MSQVITKELLKILLNLHINEEMSEDKAVILPPQFLRRCIAKSQLINKTTMNLSNA